MSRAQSMYKWIQERLADGMTVQLITYSRATEISPATWERFEESGRPVLKLSQDGARLLLSEGKHYVDATWVTLKARG